MPRSSDFRSANGQEQNTRYGNCPGRRAAAACSSRLSIPLHWRRGASAASQIMAIVALPGSGVCFGGDPQTLQATAAKVPPRRTHSEHAMRIDSPCLSSRRLGCLPILLFSSRRVRWVHQSPRCLPGFPLPRLARRLQPQTIHNSRRYETGSCLPT